jgi:hypothetical protein
VQNCSQRLWRRETGGNFSLAVGGDRAYSDSERLDSPHLARVNYSPGSPDNTPTRVRDRLRQTKWGPVMLMRRWQTEGMTPRPNRGGRQGGGTLDGSRQGADVAGTRCAKTVGDGKRAAWTTDAGDNLFGRRTHMGAPGVKSLRLLRRVPLHCQFCLEAFDVAIDRGGRTTLDVTSRLAWPSARRGMDGSARGLSIATLRFRAWMDDGPPPGGRLKSARPLSGTKHRPSRYLGTQPTGRIRQWIKIESKVR